MSNSEIWPIVNKYVEVGQCVHNWTILNRCKQEDFLIVHVGENYLEIETPKAINPIRVNRKDFENIWKIWPEYKNGKMLRQELKPITFNSKYVISILHWMETERK